MELTPTPYREQQQPLVRTCRGLATHSCKEAASVLLSLISGYVWLSSASQCKHHHRSLNRSQIRYWCLTLAQRTVSSDR